MLTITLADPPDAPATTRGNVYLPIAANQTDPAAEFCRLLTADPRQERPSLSGNNVESLAAGTTDAAVAACASVVTASVGRLRLVQFERGFPHLGEGFVILIH